jgi:hypothetical protein
MKKVSCHICGKKRTPHGSGGYFIWNQKKKHDALMTKDSNTGKWECYPGHGCRKDQTHDEYVKEKWAEKGFKCKKGNQ